MKDLKPIKLSEALTGFILGILLLIFLFAGRSNAQVIDVKKWTGSYPEMNGTYPLTFIAFKGLLPPIPHVFIRVWPTHYYWDLISLPVTDATEIAGGTKTGLLRIAAKMLERSQMKGRYNETGQIKINTNQMQEIEKLLFDSRSDQLEDLYRLAGGFIRLYGTLDAFGKTENIGEVRAVFEKEADELLMRFLMVNLFQTGNGEKVAAFSEIFSEQNRLYGEIDYTHQKIRFFNSHKKTPAMISYSFLTQ